MRICVVGAGAIGGLLAARLWLAGNDVSVLARGESLTAIEAQGITLLQPDGSQSVATGLRASSDAASLGDQDLVLLAVKAHQLPAVAEAIPILSGPLTVVLALQNGIPWWFFHRFPGELEGRRLSSLDPDGVLERAIPADRVLGSIAYPAAEREAPGVVRLVEGDRFPVGELDGEMTTRAAAVAGVLSGAGFTSRVVRDIRSHIWVKAWGNLAFNPISALTGATLSEMVRLPASRELATRMMSEAATIAERLGLRLRLSVEQRIEGAGKVGDHKTSMLQDVEAGRPLELEALVGSFVELGRLTGTATPSIEAVYALTSALDHRIRTGERLLHR
ncbi:MAG: 2-dehydropantoate 2-reductase [Acidimicrobiales bacterium]